VARIQQAGGVASYRTTDVTVEAQVQALIEHAVRAYGGVDVLVSSAGAVTPARLLETTEENWDRTLAVNLKGHFLCAKHTVPAMLARGGGSIVFMGSVHGLIGAPELLAYAVAKGGLWTMTRNLARSYAADHIRVNYVNPGWVASEGETVNRRNLGFPDEWLAEQGRQLPMGRLQTPEDTGRVVVLLASDDATQITGTWFNVDGGQSMM
jgi:NAD(P)-dependent dehydrogenase (short-subunit alcohol dehydrogenase family)